MVTALVLAVTLAPQVSPEPTAQGPPLRVSAHYIKERHVLRMTATNDTPAPISINEVWLPWGHLYTTALVALFAADPIGPGQVLDRVLMESDPFGSRIDIRPGESRTGDLRLDQQFPKLKIVLARTDVILFWSYVPRYPSISPDGPRTGGWLVLPRDGPAHGASLEGLDNNQQMQGTRHGTGEPRR